MPIIKRPNQHFDINLWTGNGSTQSITNAGGFQPDFVWLKERSSTSSHNVYDSIRGTTKYLLTSTTDAEGTDAASLTAFNSNGFSLGGAGYTNENAQTYVGWQWKAGGASTVNTSGSISSNVSVNATAGFSIVTYAGNSTTGATVGHGLGVTPSMIIIKSRSFGDTGWAVKHKNLSSGNNLRLNSTAAQGTLDGYGVIADLSSSTTFTLTSGGAGNTNVNSNTSAYVAYCWAEVEGFSKFGSYTGNGSADGPFVYTGFRPKFIMIKRTNTTGNWEMYDMTRNPYNPYGKVLVANASDAENDVVPLGYPADALSNGFKIRHTGDAVNANGSTYIYAAFAEAPFKYANAS